jgi:hypothetical protein
MKQLARWLWIVAILFVAMAVVENRVTATPITFTETVTASGSLGANDFTNALVTITAIANTNGVRQVPGYAGVLGVNDTSVTITVVGIGTATFTGPVFTFVNTGIGQAGMDSGTIANPGTDILDVNNSAFKTYDLKTSIGPVSGPPNTEAGQSYATTDGNLIFNAFTNPPPATFEAQVPEPSTIVCATTAVLWGLFYAYRRRRASVTLA